MFYNNKKNFMTPPPPPSTNFSKDYPEKFFRSFKKKYRAKERCRKKNSCKQLGVKKKFVHRKIAQPPPQISNGPPLIRKIALKRLFFCLSQSKSVSRVNIHSGSDICSLLPGNCNLYQEFGVRSWPNTFRARESP